MDLALTFVIAIVASVFLLRITNKFINQHQEKKKQETTSATTTGHNTFAESIGSGKKCPPHAWKSLYEDKYGLKCDWCGLTYP